MAAVPAVVVAVPAVEAAVPVAAVVAAVAAVPVAAVAAVAAPAPVRTQLETLQDALTATERAHAAIVQRAEDDVEDLTAANTVACGALNGRALRDAQNRHRYAIVDLRTANVRRIAAAQTVVDAAALAVQTEEGRIAAQVEAARVETERVAEAARLEAERVAEAARIAAVKAARIAAAEVAVAAARSALAAADAELVAAREGVPVQQCSSCSGGSGCGGGKQAQSARG